MQICYHGTVHLNGKPLKSANIRELLQIMLNLSYVSKDLRIRVKRRFFQSCEPANFGKYPHLHIACELLPKFAHAWFCIEGWVYLNGLSRKPAFNGLVIEQLRGRNFRDVERGEAVFLAVIKNNWPPSFQLFFSGFAVILQSEERREVVLPREGPRGHGRYQKT